MHLSYNENITPFLDALEQVNAQTPLDGLRWSIEHAETIPPEKIERVKRLGGGIALDGKRAMNGDALVRTYSGERAPRTPALRRLVAAAIPAATTSAGCQSGAYIPGL